MKILATVLLFSSLTFAQAIKVGPTHYKKPALKVLKTNPVRHPFKFAQATVATVVSVPLVASFDALEASVDSLGIAVQTVANAGEAVGNGIKDAAATLGSVGKPLVYVGDVVYYPFDYLDKAGAFLAK